MKFKQIPDNYFVTILDRLSRFEPANVRFERVFNDIISKFYNLKFIENSLEEKIDLVVEIINNSFEKPSNNFHINEILLELEKKYFDYDENSIKYLSSKIDFYSMIEKIVDFKNLPKNVKWLTNIYNSKKNIFELRKEKSLLYPIEKVLLCEGQTELELLNTLLLLYGYDTNKEGILIYPAGGKNQVAKKYYQMLEYTKTPFFILLDYDAQSIKELIEPKLRQKDKIFLLKSGEFEDLIPKNIVLKTINNIHNSEINCNFDDFADNLPMTKNIENIYRKYGFGDFKKAYFAQELKKIVSGFNENDFINSEIQEIVLALQ